MVERYAKPKPAAGLPKWYLQIRANSDFMPAKIKPYSYEKLAAAESKNRQALYATTTSPSWATPASTSGMAVSSQVWNKPTEDVASGIKKNYNMTRDEIALNAEKPGPVKGFFTRAIDVVSRPLYGFLNMHKENVEKHYATANSAGGTKVTLGEHLKAVASDVFNNSLLGVAKDVSTGNFDDKFKSAWAGLSGKEKTTTSTILESEYSGFAKEHPKATLMASIVGDIVFDPLTWVTLGISGPGTITKSLGAAALGTAGKKTAAKALLQETLLTPTGIRGAKEALRVDRYQAELRKLTRQESSLNRQVSRAAKGKYTRLSDAARQDKINKVTRALADLKADEIKGANFAWKVLRSSIPTVGLNTLSKANIGASTWRKAKTSSELTGLYNDFVKTTATEWREKNLFGGIHTALALSPNGIEDVRYEFGGHHYVIPLSKTKDEQEFYEEIVKATAPVARVAEHNIKAARSRKARNISTRTKGQAAEDALSKKFGNVFSDAMDQKAAVRFEAARGSADAIYGSGKVTEETARQAGNVYFEKEDDLLNMDLDDLSDLVKSERKKAGGKKTESKDRSVYVKDENGTIREVNLEVLRTSMARAKNAASRRRNANAAMAARSAEQTAADAAAGLNPSIVTAREGIVAAVGALRKARETQAAGEASKAREVSQLEGTVEHLKEVRNAASDDVIDANNALTPGGQGILDHIKNLLTSEKFTDKEKAEFSAILNDTSLTQEERLLKLLQHEDMSDVTAIRAVKDQVNFKIEDGHLIADGTGLGENEQNIVNLVNTVLKDRLDERVTPEMLKASGIKITMENGVPKIIKSSARSSGESSDYLGDINTEIGMAMLDAYRLAIDYATKSEEMNVPERAFLAISSAMDDFIEGATADIKRQVFQFMYEATGMRLPEKFVPQMDEVIARLPVPGNEETRYVFTKADSDKPLVNQDIPWRNLGLDMQRWVFNTFNFLGGKLAKEGRKDMGGDIDHLASGIEDLAKQAHVEDEPVNEAMKVLRLAAVPALLNGDKQVVNRYSVVDFLLHGKEILLSQKESLTVSKIEKGDVGQRVAGRRAIGRLSAVDSFTYVDEDVKTAIEVIEDLKRRARTDKNAQIILSKLFLESGGLDHLNSLKTATGDVKDVDFVSSFKTLGIHARLKHEAVGRDLKSESRTLQTKHRADLMDDFWSTQTINHEWQKAMHHRILVDTIMDGKSVSHAAQTISKNLEEVFMPYEDILAKMRPKAHHGEPVPELNPKIRVEEPPTPTEPRPTGAAGVSKDPADIESVANLHRKEKKRQYATTDLRMAEGNLSRAKARQVPGVDPELEADVKSAQDAYIAAHRAEEAPDPLHPGDADFANVNYTRNGYSPEELEAIKGWIATQYADRPPQKLAMELNALSRAMSHDIMVAQDEILGRFKEFSIKHNTSLNIMGVPLMNIPNPMNATHALAGITSLAQSKSKGAQFWERLTSPYSDLPWVKNKALNNKKRTHIINQGLDHILTDTANAATTYRKEWIPAINQMYKKWHIGKLEDTATNAMGQKARKRLLNKFLFSHTIPDVDAAIRVFKDIDGENYVEEVLEDFRQVGTRAFPTSSRDDWDAGESLEAFNRYMHADYRLTDLDVREIDAAYRAGRIDRKLVPYSTEWLKEISIIVPEGSKLHAKRLEDVRLGGMHYAIHDAYVKQRAGHALHEGVFSEFATRFDARKASFLNDVLQPLTTGVKGEPMRGKLIPVDSLWQPGGSYSISKKYIPARMQGTGFYISEDIVPEIQTLIKYMEEAHALNDTINQPMLNKVLSYFKAAVTVYNIPTYPIRNLISDVFMGAMDGLVNPRYYKDAMALWWEHKQSLKNMNPRDYQEILDNNWMQGELHRAMADPASVMQPNVNPNAPVKMRVPTEAGVQELTAAHLYQAFDQLSLSQNRTSYDIPRAVAASRGNVVGRAGGAISDKIMELNDVREDWARMAHFMYAIEKEAPLGGTIDDIFRRAADRVIKYHFDYSDVSLSDMRYTAKVIPFYKWTKNIIPFTITNVLFKPKFLNIERALSEATGGAIDDDSSEGYLPDIVVPSWIKHDMPVPIGTWSDPNGNEFQQFALMYLPLGDTLAKTISPTLDPLFNSNLSLKEKGLQSVEGAVSTAGELSTPPIKAAVQAATGRVMHASGAAPEKPNENWANTLSTMIPGIPTLSALQKSVEGIAGSTTGENGKNKKAELMKALGILRTYDNSENNQLGELKRQEDMHRSSIDRAKAKVSANLKKNYPNATPAQIEAVIEAYLKETRAMDSGRL